MLVVMCLCAGVTDHVTCVSCDVFVCGSYRSCVSVVMCLCAGVTDHVCQL